MLHQGEKQGEARSLNRQFTQDARRVYAEFNLLCDVEEARPRYQKISSIGSREGEMFEDIEDTSSFWRELWETRGSGNEDAAWLQEMEDAIAMRVPPPPEEPWQFETSQGVRILLKKRNWSAPGPDKLVNYWWKRAHALHDGVTWAFLAISKSEEEYPGWFTEGKTSLLPKPGDFYSENQRPIMCLNNIYKWFTSCLQSPMDSHLKEFNLMEGQQRGTRVGCSGRTDNLLIDRMVTLDCHKGKRNLSMA